MANTAASATKSHIPQYNGVENQEEPSVKLAESAAKSEPPSRLGSPSMGSKLSITQYEIGPGHELKGLSGGACVMYNPTFIAEHADRYLANLLPGGAARIPWTRGEIVCYGRVCKEARDTAHFGDDGTSYRYSGRSHVPHAWSDDPSGTLYELLSIVRTATGKPFNYCLLNLYAPNDTISPHSDDERNLVPGVGIFSISLGFPRLFELRAKSTAVKGRPIAMRLAHGSALWMAGLTQRTHVHWIDAEKTEHRQTALRVNLTFRAITGQKHG